MELFFSNIITALLLFLGGLWLKNYLPSYFNEKGKLLAQKEDIEEITSKIEKVKQDFSNETELLRSGLQRLINLEMSHRNEERNCIIEFYSKCNQWLYALLEINFGAYDKKNIKDLIEKRDYIEKFYSESGIYQSKVKLIVQDEEIVSIAAKLWIALLEYKNWISKQLLSLQQNIESQIYLTDEFLPLMKKFDENKNRLEKIAEEDSELRLKFRELINKFYENKVAEYKKIIPIDNLFADKVKAYLTK